MVWLLLEERGAAARRIPLNNTKKAPPGDEKKEKINGLRVCLPLSSIKRKGLQKKVARTLSIESSGRKERERDSSSSRMEELSLKKKSSPWRTPTTRERTRWEETDRASLVVGDTQESTCKVGQSPRVNGMRRPVWYKCYNKRHSLPSSL